MKKFSGAILPGIFHQEMLPSEQAFIYPAVARHIDGGCPGQADDLDLWRDETLTRK